jgi:phage shock protein PspC (stress-responsive transcriptional regulator)
MSDYTTHTQSIKRLERSSSDKMLAGVAGGLGRYFDLSPAVFRLGLIVLTLIGGAGILIYLAAILVIPAEGKDLSIAGEVLAQRRDRPWPLVGLGLAGAALVVLLARGASWPASGAGWGLILVLGLVVLWSSRREGRGRRVVLALTGVVAVLVTAAIVAIAAAFASFDVSLGDGVGDRTYQPATAAQLKSSYHMGIGDLVVDLSNLPPGTSKHVDAHVGMGHLKIIVPNRPVTVHSHVKYGVVHQYGVRHSGHGVDVQTGGGQLTVDAGLGTGRIDVVRAG